MYLNVVGDSVANDYITCLFMQYEKILMIFAVFHLIAISSLIFSGMTFVNNPSKFF